MVKKNFSSHVGRSYHGSTCSECQLSYHGTFQNGIHDFLVMGFKPIVHGKRKGVREPSPKFAWKPSKSKISFPIRRDPNHTVGAINPKDLVATMRVGIKPSEAGRSWKDHDHTQISKGE